MSADPAFWVSCFTFGFAQGDVYCGSSDCTGAANQDTVTLTLPSVAFYLYAEADEFGTFQITATSRTARREFLWI